MSNANTIETPTNRNDAALRFYSDLSELLHDIGSSRIMHIVLTQGNLSFLHQATRYNAAPGDYIILPNAALAQDFAASSDFKALLFSLSPSIGNRLALRSNYGIIGHLSLLQNPVMRLAEVDFMRCRTDIERLYERWLATGHYFHKEMVGHLLAAHILDLYDIHARNCLPEDFPTRAAELLRRFTEDLARGSFRRYRNLDWYAEKLCVTPHYLSEICRRASGRSASYFVDLFTLQEIANLLADKRLSVAKSFRVLRRLTLRDTSRNTSACRPKPFAMPDPTKSFRFSGSCPHLLIGQEYGRLAEK